MKKSVSIILALAAVFVLSITAFAEENQKKLFSVSPEEGFSDEEIYSFAIEKGDCIIMLSDGVTGADEDERWLSELIRLDTKDEPAVLASTLIERAKELSGANDDMSAVVIKII